MCDGIIFTGLFVSKRPRFFSAIGLSVMGLSISFSSKSSEMILRVYLAGQLV